MEDDGKARRREKIKAYIDASSKSPVVGVIYALVFGPLGCLYTNPASTAIALAVAIGLGLIYLPLIALVWLACMVMAPFQVRAYNHRIRSRARFNVT